MNKKYAICYNSNMLNSTNVKDELCSILDNSSVLYDVLDIDNLTRGYDFVFVARTAIKDKKFNIYIGNYDENKKYLTN